MAQISNPKNDRRSLTHAFHEVEPENGELSQNTPDVNSPVLKWTCPRKWSRVRYAGGTHKTKFVPRTKQTVTISDDDGDGALSEDERTVVVESTIQPINGETNPDDQPYPPVVAFNVTQGTEIEPADYAYPQNEVTFADGDVAAGDEVAMWPILNRGTLQYRGLDQFDHEIAPLDEWSEPIHVFHDFDQNKNETEIHLVGAAEWTESETLALYIDSPDQIVWEDADYPRGNYVSTIEQRVDVSV